MEQVQLNWTANFIWAKLLPLRIDIRADFLALDKDTEGPVAKIVGSRAA